MLVPGIVRVKVNAKTYSHIITVARSGHVNFAVPVTGPIQEEICSDHVARIDPSLGERVCITVDDGAEQLAIIIEHSNGYPEGPVAHVDNLTVEMIPVQTGREQGRA
jgi:hypothetical protein